MSVSDTGHLSALDAVLYDRPAGRNIIDYAREEIERLNALILAVSNNIASSPAKVLEESVLVGKALDRLVRQDQEIERLRSALETILTVPAGEGTAASMSKIALQALGVREARK